MNVREFINLLNESAAGQQYLLATHNLETNTWRVTFHNDRTAAHVAYTQWKSAFVGDAYIAPVELKYHASADRRKQAVTNESAKKITKSVINLALNAIDRDSHSSEPDTKERADAAYTAFNDKSIDRSEILYYYEREKEFQSLQ